MLTQDVRDALSAELEHLRIRRKKLTERLDQKIAAIEALVSTQDDEDGQALLPLGNAGKTNGPLAGKGCREAIKAVLSAYPNLKPAEIAAKMDEMGWAPNGSTPIKVRVGSELHRMRKQKMLVKKGARLSLAPTAVEAEATNAA